MFQPPHITPDDSELGLNRKQQRVWDPPVASHTDMPGKSCRGLCEYREMLQILSSQCGFGLPASSLLCGDLHAVSPADALSHLHGPVAFWSNGRYSNGLPIVLSIFFSARFFTKLFLRQRSPTWSSRWFISSCWLCNLSMIPLAHASLTDIGVSPSWLLLPLLPLACDVFSI